MTTLEMSEQDPNMEGDENNEVYKDEPIVITIPGIDHLDEWMILELERKKRLIGYLEQIGDDDVAEIKNYWFPNGVDGVPNLEPYKRFLKPAEEDEQDEESKRREEQEFIEKSDPLHIDRGMQRVSKVFKNAGSTIASYWKSTLRPTLSIAKKTPEEIANEPLPLKVLTSPYWLMGLSLVYVGASYNIYRSFGHKVNSVLLSYAFYKSAKMINNNEMNGYRWAAAASAAAFFTSIATTSQRRDLAPIYRPKYVGPRYFTLISIPFFAYYYNRIQTVPLVQEIKQTKEVIIDSFDKSREWVKTTIKRWRGNKPEGEAHGEDDDIDFLKQAADIKKQEMKANNVQRRGGGLPMDGDDE